MEQKEPLKVLDYGAERTLKYDICPNYTYVPLTLSIVAIPFVRDLLIYLIKTYHILLYDSIHCKCDINFINSEYVRVLSGIILFNEQIHI